LHGEGPEGTLNKDEVSIVKAVLDLRDKTAERIMTKIDDVFMIPFSGFLNKETFEMVV
jgi:metal transporter CNNM